MTGPTSLALVATDPDGSAARYARELAESAGWTVASINLEPNWTAVSFSASAHAAKEAGADWSFFLAPGEIVHPALFEILPPYIGPYNAIWGGVSAVEADGERDAKGKLIRKSRLACQDYRSFFHLALHWWIGRSHIIRTDLAAFESSELGGMGDDWYIHYLLALWQGERCIKTAQPLTCTPGALPDLSAGERWLLLDVLAKDPVFMPVRLKEKMAYLTYTGENLNVEREQTRGLFYEEAELWDLADYLPEAPRIVDVGANTGNHSVFFSMAFPKANVLPIEPADRNIAALRAAVRVNGLKNVDLTKLGIGAGASAGRASLDRTSKSLGETRLEADPGGEIMVQPLDDLVDGPVDFVKIDVEGMELDVLAGAAGLLEKHAPVVFIEIADENFPDFMVWLASSSYRVERIYPDKSHANFILVPEGSVL